MPAYLESGGAGGFATMVPCSRVDWPRSGGSCRSRRRSCGHSHGVQGARVVGGRVMVSGDGPQSADGSPADPFGQVLVVATLEQATDFSARLAELSILASDR
jgi:hypothetical protein